MAATKTKRKVESAYTGFAQVKVYPDGINQWELRDAASTIHPEKWHERHQLPDNDGPDYQKVMYRSYDNNNIVPLSNMFWRRCKPFKGKLVVLDDVRGGSLTYIRLSDGNNIYHMSINDFLDAIRNPMFFAPGGFLCGDFEFVIVRQTLRIRLKKDEQ